MANNMPTIASPSAANSITRLEWDSNHFGFSVGRIHGELSDDDLHAALVQARARRFRLVYWATALDREIAPHVLEEFGGRFVDRKVTFARSLAGCQPESAAAARMSIAPFGRSQVPTELLDLAIAAGAYSRFALDPRIPRDRFEQLYREWIEQCVHGELAGAVLVARDAASNGAEQAPASNGALAGSLAGMIAIKVTGDVGNIGLIAVSVSHRGRGIGSQLMDAAHDWMLSHGAARATVVTQAANAPACRLYERTGYSLEHAENYYHFWPQPEA